MNEKSDSTNQNLDCSSNMNSGIKTEMDSSGYDVGFSHLPQVQRIVKLERESSFGKYPYRPAFTVGHHTNERTELVLMKDMPINSFRSMKLLGGNQNAPLSSIVSISI